MDCMSCRRSTLFLFHSRLPWHKESDQDWRLKKALDAACQNVTSITHRNISSLFQSISLSVRNDRCDRPSSCPCQSLPSDCGEEYSSWIRPRATRRRVSCHTRKCGVCSCPLDWLKWRVLKLFHSLSFLRTAIDESLARYFILGGFELVRRCHVTLGFVILAATVVATVVRATSSVGLKVEW